jgi:hypothetical protein
MVLNEKVLTSLLGYYTNWRSNPEAFYKLVMLTVQLTCTEGNIGCPAEKKHMAMELARLLLQTEFASIAPHKDFAELYKHYWLQSDDLITELEIIIQEAIAEDTLFSLTEEMGIMPSIETMAKEIDIEAEGRDIVDKLRPHIDFY